jgi:uncharacterized Zn-binding protein involved in type VI secretion
MGLTVYADGMGLFHKGSGGSGIAPGDVCLSPPPPPAGPAPVPYVNSVTASDLSKGSRTVKIDGEPTALEDKSEVSTSTGDEAGTQGGNVVTHKTKGKASFSLWSFTVKIEGKGVGRHGDPMGQNHASMPYGCIDMQAMTAFQQKGWKKMGEPCTKKYKRPKEGRPNAAQRAQIEGKACWWSPCTSVGTVPDHQPPLVVAWAMGGCHNEEAFKEWAKSTEATPRGHCLTHSRMQMRLLSNMYRRLEVVKAVVNFIAGLA